MQLGRYLAVALVLRVAAGLGADNPAGPDKYGPFSVQVTDSRLCKGPKRAECGAVSLVNSANFTHSSFTVVLPQKITIEQVKIVMSAAAARARPDLSWRVPRPCEHVVLAPSLHALYDVDYKDCGVRKGEHKFNVSLTSSILQFAGAHFFYGTYRSKFLLLSGSCNVLCLLTELVLTKK